MPDSTTTSERDSRPKRSGEHYNEAELDRVYDYVALGNTISEIATILDRSHASVQRIVLEYPERYEEAKEKRRDMIRAERRNRAFAGASDPHSWRFLDNLAEEQLPETRQARTRHVEVSVPEPPELPEGGRPVSIADVARLAAELGIRVAIGVDGGDARGALPPAEDVLSDPPQD